MIVFGTKGRAIGTGQQISELECPSCSQRALFPRTYLRYFHFFWIPLLPVRKLVYLECAHCKRTIEPNRKNATVDTIVREAKRTSSIPAPLFLGLPIVVGLFWWVIQTRTMRDAYAKERAAAPTVDDIYVFDSTQAPAVRQDANRFVVARVVTVSPDNVEVQFSHRGYDSLDSAERAIEGKDTHEHIDFAAEKTGLGRPALVTWQQRRGLLTVLRK